MGWLDNFQSKNDNKDKIIVAVVVMFVMTNSLFASRILENAKKVLDALQIEISVTIPLAATIIFFGLAIGYAGCSIKVLSNRDMVRWVSLRRYCRLCSPFRQRMI
ncbi:conjugal transfer protein [Bartonella sp. B39]